MEKGGGSGKRSYRPRFMRPHGCNGTLCETWGPNKRAFVLLPLKKKEEREGKEEGGGERRIENVPSNKSNLSFALFSFAI